MSEFVTDLDVSLVDDRENEGRGCWRLHFDLIYQSDVAGITVTVPAGFMTDFASVPRLPLAFMLAGDTCHEAAVIHDYLYRTKPHPTTREIADKILREAAIVTGIPAWRAQMVYLGVRIGGAFTWGT